MFSADLLGSKRILVTGGGTGLGAAMAKRFAALGAEVVICGRRAGVLEKTAADIRDAGGKASGIVCDIRDPGAVEALMDQAFENAPLTSLVNNAGAIFIAQTEHLSTRAVDAILAPTLHGAVYCTLAAGKRWIDGKQPGVVLSILSTNTITGRAFTTPSAIAKAGLLAMTRSLAVEWASKRVRMVAIAPGSFPTDGFLERVRGGRPSAGSVDGDNTLERVGHPDELANLASFLLSDAASYINGEMVTIDGARHLRGSGVEDLLKRTEDEWAATRQKRS